MKFKGALSPFNVRGFRNLWLASLLSNTGVFMQAVAQPWLVFSLSGSAVLLGLDAFATDAPFILLILVGGILADRLEKRKVLFCFQALQMLCPLLIVALLLTNHISVWVIIVLSLVVGTTDALSMPSYQAIIPSLVAPDEISKAVALNSTQFNTSRMIGPVLAGITMGALGATWCFGLNAISYVPLLLSVYFLKLPRRTVPKSEMFEAEFVPISFKHILSQRRIMMILLLVTSNSILCGPVLTFIPVLAKDVYHVGAEGFSLCLAFFGLGALIGAGIVVVNAPRLKMAFSGALLLVAMLAVLSINLSLYVALFVFFLCGIGFMAVNISANTIIQTTVQDHSRGRGASLFLLAMRGGLPIGNLLTGFSVETFGIQKALFLNASLAFVTYGILIVLTYLSQNRISLTAKNASARSR